MTEATEKQQPQDLNQIVSFVLWISLSTFPDFFAFSSLHYTSLPAVPQACYFFFYHWAFTLIIIMHEILSLLISILNFPDFH